MREEFKERKIKEDKVCNTNAESNLMVIFKIHNKLIYILNHGHDGIVWWQKTNFLFVKYSFTQFLEGNSNIRLKERDL